MQRIGVFKLCLLSERSNIGVGQLTFVQSRKRGFNILFYEMSQFDAVQLSNLFGTGVNGSRVKINNKIG